MKPCQTSVREGSSFYLGLILAWLAVAIALGALGVIAKLRPPLPQFVLITLTAILLAAFWRVARFRTWILGLPLRALVLLHITRFVGFYFLVLHARGELPYAFAVPGGWGDIAVAATALLVLPLSPYTSRGRRAYLVWNALGLLDILMVVVTAARLALADPNTMIALVRFPLSLLPTFLVPLLIASHVIMLVRLLPLHPKRSSN